MVAQRPVVFENGGVYKRPNRYRFLYLVRHGQYVASDEYPRGELTELGVQQAEAVARHLSDVPFDAIWSSTMSRAEQTADIIVEHAFDHIEPKRSRLLREKAFKCDHEWWETVPDRNRAPADLLDRIASRWLRPSRSERHELLVCHGNVIRAIVTRVLRADLECWFGMHILNCSVTRIVCLDSERNRLLSFNEHGWLEPELHSMH